MNDSLLLFRILGTSEFLVEKKGAWGPISSDLMLWSRKVLISVERTLEPANFAKLRNSADSAVGEI